MCIRDSINGQLQGYQAQLDEGKKQMYAQGLISSPNLDNDQMCIRDRCSTSPALSSLWLWSDTLLTL